ncbi:hypothetical protein DLM78_19600 [Leptospira stimsonii]|uniref:Uncharacterized protein n=1 Tax=Leptospira stimsonii TaxID=2202203 RepID=A0A8B3CK78_9LEPT|nr:hypothetical protein DLM78_19600 [Leptospira stimsonii]
MVGISISNYEATKRRILKIRNSERLPSGSKKRKKKWNRKAEGTGLYASISEAPSKKKRPKQKIPRKRRRIAGFPLRSLPRAF